MMELLYGAISEDILFPVQQHILIIIKCIPILFIKNTLKFLPFPFCFFQTGYFNLYRFGNDKAIISTVNLKNYITIQIIDKNLRCLRDTIVYHNTITDYYYKYDITIMDNSYTFLLIRYGLMPIIFTLALMVVRFQMTIKI